MIELVPEVDPYTKHLNEYSPEHYKAYKKITAEEWNALFIALMNQGNLQEESFSEIYNDLLPEIITAVNELINQVSAIDSDLTGHINNRSNPHQVTKAQVGLGNVDNTSDANKPISSATQAALNTKQATLVSGQNIKTVNNKSLLGSGNIEIDDSKVIWRKW